MVFEQMEMYHLYFLYFLHCQKFFAIKENELFFSKYIFKIALR